jgi:hypothetical protein
MPIIWKPQGKRDPGRKGYEWQNIQIDLIRKVVGECGLDSAGSKQTSIASSFQHFSSVNYWQFLGEICNY